MNLDSFNPPCYTFPTLLCCFLLFLSADLNYPKLVPYKSKQCWVFCFVFFLFLVWFLVWFVVFLTDLGQMKAWSILWWDRFRNWTLSKLIVAFEVWVSALSEWPSRIRAEMLGFAICPKDSGTFVSPSANGTEALSLAVPMGSLVL